MSTATSVDTAKATVEAALDALLAANDPKKMDNVAFRGARYDHGLAWVHFPEGCGGLGVRPDLNRLVEERLRKAGAAPQDPATFFIALAGPTIATHGSEEVKKRWPAFETGKFYPPKAIEDPAFADDPYDQLSALFDPLSGFMDDPMLAAHNLAHAAKQHGAEFLFHKEVSEITRDGDVVSGVVLKTGERFEAPIVINAAGPHAAAINRMAGVYDEMKVHHRPLRQEVFSPPAPKGFRLEDNAPVVADLDLGQYFRPHMGDLLNVGTTEPACDPLHFLDDADNWNDSVSVEFFERVMLRLARRLPDFGIPHKLLGIGALYDVTDDWIPLYDKSSLPGFFMACGTSGNQFKNAPLVGKFMRTLIEAQEQGIDHDVTPVEVMGEFTGMPINLSAFSRLRTQADTAGNVMG